MRILIKVTKEILEQSAYCAAGQYTTNCAIACAIRCLWPTARVRGSYIAIFKDVFEEDYITSMQLPVEAVLFIMQFDRSTQEERKKMDPISFEIDVPDSVIESIGISEAERIISNSLTMEKV